MYIVRGHKNRGRDMRTNIDLTSENFFRNPAAAVEQLRTMGPAVEIRFPIVGRVWITTTHETAARMLKDSETFTLRRDGGAAAGLRWWMPQVIRTIANNMLTMDEPDHTRLREIVDEAFRRRAVLEMEPRIRAIADALADDLFAEGSPADLVDRYARRIPLAVICELLGLPAADRPRFMAWTSSFTRLTNLFGFFALVPAMMSMRRYLEKQLEAARRQSGEGLIAELVRFEKEGGRISPDEMVAMVFLLLGAGTETTTHLISGSVFELLRNPERRDWLEEDWSRINLAIEEFLRFVSPVQFSKPRHVRRNVDLDGVRLKAGDKIMAMIVAANMDPAANDHPERLDLERHPNRHIAFGTGIHFCLGHQLARIEARCAIEALLTRWPKIALAIPQSRIRWRARPGIRALASLPVADGAAAHDSV